jgi:hypothetical protein
MYICKNKTLSSYEGFFSLGANDSSIVSIPKLTQLIFCKADPDPLPPKIASNRQLFSSLQPAVYD